MAEATNLPSNQLSPQSRRLFLSAIQSDLGMTFSEERRLADLPVPAIRIDLTKRLRSLEVPPLTRPECDACLKFLALTLPRGGLSTRDAHDMMDMYFGLLREAGVTGEMLMKASKTYVMRPSGDKGKFFPDPSQLAEICAAEIDGRKKAIAAARRGLQVLDGGAGHGDDGDRGGKPRKLSDALKGCRTFEAAPDQAEPVESGASVNEILAQRDPAAVERLRNMSRTKEQA